MAFQMLFQICVLRKSFAKFSIPMHLKRFIYRDFFEKRKKSERVECILANAIVPISKKEILEKVPDISVKTVELVLSKMLKNNSIKKIGTYKDARYIKK